MNNGQVTRFRNSGTISVGGNVIGNIITGTLRLVVGGRASIVDYDGSEMATDIREGDAQPSRVTLSAKMTADDAFYALLTADGTDGNKPKLELIITRPSFRGSTSGERLTLSNAVVEGEVTKNEGEEFDTLEVTFLVPDHRPQWVAYTP